MPLLRASVDVRNEFPRITREILNGAHAGVEEGARVGARVSGAIAAERHIEVRPGNASRSVDGVVASYVFASFATVFQEWGTLGNRRKPLKQPPRTDRTRAPGTGVKPMNAVGKGRAAGRRAMLERIRRTLPR